MGIRYFWSGRGSGEISVLPPQFHATELVLVDGGTLPCIMSMVQ